MTGTGRDRPRRRRPRPAPGTDSTRLSRRMSWVLRHRGDPRMDAAGWLSLDALVDLLGDGATRDDVAQVLARGDRPDAKQRFERSPDGTRIRARYGHSIDVDVTGPSAPDRAGDPDAGDPPAVLYHGTHRGALARIRSRGLRPMGRRHVHLSADPATAREVGARRGEPVVLTVDAAGLARDGAPLHHAGAGVWLTGPVAPRYLRLPTPPS